MRTFPGAALFALTIGAQNPAYIPVWQGREALQYCIDPALEPLRSEIRYAFWTWAAQTGLPYAETRDCGEPRTIAYRLGAGIPMSTLGITGYPPVRLPEEQAPDGSRPAGDVVLNGIVPWTTQPGMGELAMAVLLHETGHAFGLGHSADPQDVMFPMIQIDHIALSLRERATVRFLYRGEPIACR